LIASEGELWKDHRKILSPFYNEFNTEKMTPNVINIVNSYLNENWNKDVNEIKSIGDEMCLITMNSKIIDL
jgi:cytochrome P450